MVAIHETAYPRLSSNVNKQDLQRVYTPSQEEFRWLKSLRLSQSANLIALIYLKCLQRLGYFPNLDEIPLSIVSHLATYLNLTVDTADISQWVSTSLQRLLKTKIRAYCGIAKFTSVANGPWLEAFALSIAETKENVIDIINAMLEILVKEEFELPALSTLERMAYNARATCNTQYFDRIERSLSEPTKQRLLQLLSESLPDGTTQWNQLKYEPEKPSVRTLQRFVEHILWLQPLQKDIGDLPDIPEEKRYQFFLEARAYTSDKIKALQPKKRIALIALLIREQLLRATDNLVDLFIKEIRKLHNHAQMDLEQFQKGAVAESEQLICMLREVSATLCSDTKVEEQQNRILSTLDHNPHSVVDRCDRLVSHGLNNPLQFLSKRYTQPLRKGLLDCLSLLVIDHTAQGSHLLTCVKAILRYRPASLKTLAVAALAEDAVDGEVPLDWVKENWHSLLYVDRNRKIKNRLLVMAYFELGVLSEVARRFQSGDLYVGNSTKYDDYRNHLVSWEEYHQLIGQFCALTNINANAKSFVAQLKHAFSDIALATDQKIPRDTFLVIKDGTLSLKKRPSQSVSLQQSRLDQALREQLPDINIIDLLMETTQWLQLGKKFGPLSGHQGKLHHYSKRLVATLFCYGCNLGPTQTARSIEEISRKQVAYLNLNHTREKDLMAATEQVINAYNEYELPGHWGTGASASVDGTRFDMYEQNLLSEYHLRYASYGGIGYYLVSDQYIALFSRFIPCGVREALHLIDGILENTSDIQPDRIHGDTHAQSTIVFGLAHLLGIQLMPRIKDINSMVFFKPDKSTRYTHIESLFSEGINYDCIRSHLPDMLRIAVSIREGKVTASTILRRLGSKGICNSLYYAFRELGRVVRTQFLLQYISDIELRETVQAATCKSEEFNHFVQWIFFYNSGVIQENLRYAQDKMIRYNHLVANLIILHNVNAMTKALNTLKKDGFPITAETLRGLSPYRTEHINLLGNYSINIPKRMGKRHFKLS